MTAPKPQTHERLIYELKRKYPSKARRAQRSPLAAIRLFCLECMGGSFVEVKVCTCTDCTLHPFRFDSRPRIGQPILAPETTFQGEVGGKVL